MSILFKCEEIVNQPWTADEKLAAVCDALRTDGAMKLGEYMRVFDLVESFTDQEFDHIDSVLMEAQTYFIAHNVLHHTPYAQALVNEFYNQLLYENPDMVWFDRIKNMGLLRNIESKDFPSLFDDCQNSNKLTSILCANLIDVEEDLFGVQSWLMTSLSQSHNISALMAFGQSVRTLLADFNDLEFCDTTRKLLEEMAHYGLYSDPHPRSLKAESFLRELLDHSSDFNALLPQQARINPVSLTQRLDLLLHDSLGPDLLAHLWPQVEQHSYPSLVVVEHLGNYLSDYWTNTDINHAPKFPQKNSSEWVDQVFHHFLHPLSCEDRAQILYMALGRLRPENSLGRTSNHAAQIAHLPWLDAAWELRQPSFLDDKWDDNKQNNLCNHIVASRSQNACEQWISILIDDLGLSPEFFLHSTVLSTSDDMNTPWPQQWVRNHPRVQRCILQDNIVDSGVSVVKKM